MPCHEESNQSVFTALNIFCLQVYCSKYWYCVTCHLLTNHTCTRKRKDIDWWTSWAQGCDVLAEYWIWKFKSLVPVYMNDIYPHLVQIMYRWTNSRVYFLSKMKVIVFRSFRFGKKCWQIAQFHSTSDGLLSREWFKTVSNFIEDNLFWTKY